MTAIPEALVLAAGVALDKDDLAAMRMADSYTLHTHSHYNGSVLNLYLRTYGDPVVYSKRQQVLFPITHTADTRMRTIVIDGAAHGYGGVGNNGGWQWPSWSSATVREPFPGCFFSGYQRAEWATIVRTLRVGTVLKVEWTADNNTDIARDAGLHLDEVRLIATTGARVDTFTVGREACRDNSARMIRRAQG